MGITDYYDTVSAILVFTCVLTSAGWVRCVLDPAESRVARAGAEFAGMIKEKQRKSASYAALDAWLRKNGASYHTGKKTDPGRFVAMCAFLAALGFVTGLGAGFLFSVLLSVLMGMFLPLYVPARNRADARKMLPDIKLIYHSLEVQIGSGVYVTDALSECVLSVRHIRLIDALNTFSADMMMKSDIYASLEKFRSSFDDRYIDSLCITVVQALESGQAVELLSDIAEQVSDMEEDVLQSGKASLDRVLTLCQLLVLASVMGTALYTCVIYMMTKAVSF